MNNRSSRGTRTYLAILIAAVMILCTAVLSSVYADDGDKEDEDKLVPLAGYQINDGTYEGDVEDEGGFPDAEDCKLVVSGGKITATFRLEDSSATQIYFGKAYQARNDQANVINGSGGVFQVPVDVLDFKYDIAVNEGGEWKDTKVIFASDDIKKSDLVESGIKNGEYTAKASLEGGTGRAHIKSPLKITAHNGRLTARIIWSSEYYQYIKIGNAQFDKLNKKGNSRMDIPVVLDSDIQISGLTTAMSQPHLIDYTIHLDKSSLKAVKAQKAADRSSGGNTAVIIIVIAAVVIIGAAVVSRNRRKSSR